jgi:hypothetical protein
MPRVRPLLLSLVLAAALPDPAIAQVVRTQAPVEAGRVILVPGDLNQQRAEDIRRSFREAMQRYPPALGQVLKLDPSLMTNPAYMAAYPVVAEFLKLHPEVSRYPNYFLNYVETGYYNNYPPEPQDPESVRRRDVMRMWENTFEGISIFLVFLTFVFALGWAVKYFIGHRRWIRTAKVQTEVHSRLLERFASNEELLAYVQSPAGARFLQALPAVPPENGHVTGAPVNRILWSVQAGLVLACGGIGLLFIKRHVMEDVAQMMFAMGTLGLSIGIGFALAAVASYLISQRLGLLGGTSPKA